MPPKRYNGPLNYKDLANNPDAIMNLLENMNNLTMEQVMAFQSQIDAKSVPPFPANKAKKTLARVLKCTKLEEVQLVDSKQILSWCREDFYMESICESGVIDVHRHILKLCEEYAERRIVENIKTKIQ